MVGQAAIRSETPQALFSSRVTLIRYDTFCLMSACVSALPELEGRLSAGPWRPKTLCLQPHFQCWNNPPSGRVPLHLFSPWSASSDYNSIPGWCLPNVLCLKKTFVSLKRSRKSHLPSMLVNDHKNNKRDLYSSRLNQKHLEELFGPNNCVDIPHGSKQKASFQGNSLKLRLIVHQDFEGSNWSTFSQFFSYLSDDKILRC